MQEQKDSPIVWLAIINAALGDLGKELEWIAYDVEHLRKAVHSSGIFGRHSICEELDRIINRLKAL